MHFRGDNIQHKIGEIEVMFLTDLILSISYCNYDFDALNSFDFITDVCFIRK